MSPRLRYWLKNLAIKTGSINALRKVRDAIAPPVQVDYRLLERTGEVPFPSSATIEPTLACNLECTMCFQNDYRARGIAKELGADGLIHVLKSLPRAIRFVYFVGGEVFLRKGFTRMLEAADAQGIETFVTTNGTRIGNADWGVLGRLRHMTGIGFSLDGIGPVHDAVRGAGTYETIVDNIRRALTLQRTYVSFVMMESNVGHMPEFARTVAGLGVREIGFQHEIYCLPEDLRESRRRLGWSGQDEIMVTVKNRDWTSESRQQLAAGLVAMPSLERELGFVAAYEPPLPPETMPSFYDGTIRSTTRLFCRELTDLFIDPAGNVIHCGFLRKKFGNVLEQPVEAIWNSAPMREFRKTLLDGNLLPVCRRCCKLSVWPDGGAPNPASEETAGSIPALMMPDRIMKAESVNPVVWENSDSHLLRP